MFDLYLSGCCLRPKAKDLGITWVVVVLVVWFLFDLYLINSHHRATPNFYKFLKISPYLTLLFFTLSIYHHINLSIYHSIYHSIYISLFTPSIYLSLYPSITLFICLSIHPSIYLSLYTLSLNPSSSIIICQSIKRPLPFPKYQFIIEADIEASLGLVVLVGFFIGSMPYQLPPQCYPQFLYFYCLNIFYCSLFFIYCYSYKCSVIIPI